MGNIHPIMYECWDSWDALSSQHESISKKKDIVLSPWKIAWLQSGRDYLIRAFLSLNVVSTE